MERKALRLPLITFKLLIELIGRSRLRQFGRNAPGGLGFVEMGDAHLLAPASELAPSTALNAAKLLNLHLSTGDIEEAALLSNAPRRRFEVLRAYRESVGADEFKRVFAQYLAPGNRLVAEIGIDRHRLLIWDLREGAMQLAGQYFVEVDGRYLVDDVPNDARARLREVLEAYRAGRIKL